MDLTLNFIDIEDLKESTNNLSKVPLIKELYLTGNPCESWPSFKDYIIAKIPQIKILNGTEILKSERIKASQIISHLEIELDKATIENVIKKENDPDKNNPNKYTKEYRRKLYKELEEEKIQKEESKKKGNISNIYDDTPKGKPSVYKDNGEIRICNQGKYEFKLDEDYFYTGITTFELKIPKYLDTSQILVDLNPQYIRIEVKDKVTQIKFDKEVNVEGSTIQRSTTTGYLLIKAPISGFIPKFKKENKKEKSLNQNKKFFLKKDDIKHSPNKIFVDFDITDLPELD